MNRLSLRGAIIGALAAAVICTIAAFDATFFGSEWLLSDAFTRLIAKSRKTDPRIVILSIDDDTLRLLEAQGYGRPPYPRSVYSAVLRELHRAGAKIVAFDFLFTEEDINHPDDDREFAITIAQGATILGAQTGRDGITPPRDPRLWSVNGARRQWKALLPIFKSTGIGTIRLEATLSTIHTYPIADRLANGQSIPSLGVEVAREFLQLPRGGTFNRGAFSFGPIRIPVDADQAMTIRWNGKGDIPHTQYRFVEPLLYELAMQEPVPQLEAKRAAFEKAVRGKIVLIGYTAAAMLDMRPNPLSAQAPGLELHATAIDNIINREFARFAPRILILPLIIIIAALFGAILYRIDSQIASGILAILILALILGIGYFALREGIIVPNVAASSSIALTYIVITATKLLFEQQQTAMLKTTFGHYVSPQILDHVLARPDKVQLGGERREMTILFSDIRGFTTISEASQPEEVVEMLNEYLTRMVEILFEHGGTLDKFIGDAVMGFWNAPAPDPDHAKHAVACAIEMVSETAKLREKWEAENKPAIRIGVGVNTGDAVVGNIGAEKVFGYTVIGDAVNLASRLEGTNKEFGTEIIVSEFTLERIGDTFNTVYLGEVKVKGKARAVKIYQVTG